MRLDRGVRRGNNFAPGGIGMTDVIMLAVGLAFFAIALAYVIACDRM